MMITELPLGFGMALAQQPEAMKIFSEMSEDEQSKIISQLHSINSKEEMQKFVRELTLKQ